MATMYYDVCIYGKKAVDAATKILNGRCYADFMGGQIEIVSDDFIVISYIETLERAHQIIACIPEFSGCEYSINDTVQVDECNARSKEIENGILPVPYPVDDPAPEAPAPAMHEYHLTVGLFDKDTEKQEITEHAAHNILADILINRHGLYAYTAINCSGVYTMQTTGHVVREPSIRIEIVTDSVIDISAIVADIKSALNQETVMIKHAVSEIDFI